MIIRKNTKDLVNSVTKYDDMLYDTRPVKFIDFMSDKYNIIHKKLYKYALNRYINDFISKNINSKFLYELFNALNDCNRLEDIYKYIMLSDYAKDIQDSFNALRIDDEQYTEEIIKLIIERIIQLKKDIYNLDLTGILSVVTITDFILAYKEVTYMFEETGENDNEYKLIEGSIFSSELDSDENKIYNINDDFLFILENSEYGEIHIGYNKEGKWYLKIDDSIDISNIREQLESLINNTNINIHTTIKNICKEYFRSSHKIIEIKNSEYWQPSAIVIIGKKYPYNKAHINLKPWWNWYQSKSDKKISDIKITQEMINDSELVFLDYVKGIAYMKTKLDGIEYEVDFDFLDDNITVSDEYSLKDTFTYKINNINSQL